MIFLAVDLFCVRNFLFIHNNIPYLGKKKNLPGYQKQSREVTLMNGKRKIQQIASALKLKGHHVESADRFFKLAVQHNFRAGTLF
jgi:transcription initiation factor TFIIIB Brf1 subunit/transcription initiation factor TFIIB